MGLSSCWFFNITIAIFSFLYCFLLSYCSWSSLLHFLYKFYTTINGWKSNCFRDPYIKKEWNKVEIWCKKISLDWKLFYYIIKINILKYCSMLINLKNGNWEERWIYKRENIKKINKIIEYMFRVHISYKDPLRIITWYQNKKKSYWGRKEILVHKNQK